MHASGGAQVWDAQTRRCLFSMASHSKAVTAVRWGGDDHIYSASRDTSINMWDARVRRSQTLNKGLGATLR